MHQTLLSVTCAALIAWAGAAAATAADAPPTSPGSPGDAVLAHIQALRKNDLVALIAATPAEHQALAEALKASGGDRNRFIGERIDETLKTVLAADAQTQLVAAWTKRVGTTTGKELSAALAKLADPATTAAATATAATTAAAQPAADRPGRGSMRGPRGFPWESLPGVVLGNILAEGLETQQVKAMQHLLLSASTWAASVEPGNADHADKAVAALITAFKDLGVTQAADLATIDADTLLGGGGKALADLKAMVGAYGLDLDAILDSAKIEVRDVDGKPDQKLALLTFTAFSQPQAFPLKLTHTETGTWQVLADSPLTTWMGQRMGFAQVAMGAFGPPRGFGPGGGGPGGGQGNRNPANRDAGAAQTPPPATPKGDSGF